MMNETTLLRRMSRKIGSRLFECLPIDYYIDILNEETLETFSSYYPKLIKGIKITISNAIPTIDPINGVTEYHRYICPKLNSEDEYIGIEQTFFSGQGWEQTSFGANGVLANAAFSKVASLMPVPAVRWTAEFEEPHFILINPYRRNHVDFAVTMQRKTRLSEIPNGLQEYFLRLFVLDCKISLYNDFPAARDSGTINGIEVNTTLSEFSSAVSDREQLLEIFEKDYATSPNRFEAMLSQYNQ